MHIFSSSFRRRCEAIPTRSLALFLAVSLASAPAARAEAQRRNRRPPTLPSGPAGPQDPQREQARRYFLHSVELMAQGRAAEAAAELERARALRVTPAVLFNLGLAYHQLDRPRPALEALRAFVAAAQGAPSVGADQTVQARRMIEELERRVAVLGLQLDPADARVAVDGVDVSDPRLPIDLDAGRRTVRVSAPGRATVERAVELQAGTRTVLVLALPDASRAGVLDVRSEVPGAAVTVDGVVVGSCPMRESLEPGRHRIEVSAPGHTRWREEVSISAGATVELRPVLEAEGASRAALVPTSGAVPPAPSAGPSVGSPRGRAWVWPVVGASAAVVVAAAIVGVALFAGPVEPVPSGEWGVVSNAITVRGAF